VDPVIPVRDRASILPGALVGLGHVRRAVVDSDCVPEPDWLEALLRHFADPAVAAVAPRIGGRRLATGSALARYESVRSAVDLAAFEGRVRWHSRVAFVPTAAMVVRRQAVLDVGGFDEALWLAEDVDLVWRLTMPPTRSGWRRRLGGRARRRRSRAS
jgi:mycofactocin glycosyltransferase